MSDAEQQGSPVRSGAHAPDPLKLMAALKPKGACWYCNQPLDNVRRFCNKTCAADYVTEEEVFSKPA